MSKPLVLGLVGTDHHPFSRLVDWLDSWASERPEARVLVQTGRSRECRWAESTPFLEHGELLELMAGARAVVCHGGPSTIAEARKAGKIPLVVARDPAHGEHVDSHQLLFSERLAANGLIRPACSSRDLAVLLDEGLSTPDALAVHDTIDLRVDDSCRRFGSAVAALFAR